MKKLAGVRIWEYLVSIGLVEEHKIHDVFTKVQTDKGLKMGIKTIKKISQTGNPYKSLMYPHTIQKIIVNYYIGPRADKKKF